MRSANEEPDKSILPAYGLVRSPQELGRVARQERKRQDLTLDQVYSVSGLTTRFLSEFERGKPNASLGRVIRALQILGLELLVLPRGEADRFLARRRSGGGNVSSIDEDK